MFVFLGERGPGRGGVGTGRGGGFKLLSFCVRKHCGRKRRVADKSGVINVVAEQLVVNLSIVYTPRPPFLCTSVWTGIRF